VLVAHGPERAVELGGLFLEQIRRCEIGPAAKPSCEHFAIGSSSVRIVMGESELVVVLDSPLCENFTGCEPGCEPCVEPRNGLDGTL
jgi:hypothetical protein